MNEVHYYVYYKEALPYEKSLGRVLTLFDPELRRIIKKKDGSYQIEPILSIKGTNRELDMYDTTLMRKHGYLALELSEEEREHIPEDKQLVFVKEKNKFRKIPKKRMTYELLDYGFKDFIPNYEDNLLALRRDYDVQPGFNVEREFNFFRGEKVPSFRKNIRGERIGCDLYIDITDLNVVEELRKYTTSIDSTNGTVYFLNAWCGYLVDALSPNDMSPQEKKKYLNLLRNNTPVGLKSISQDTYSMHIYNESTRDLLKRTNYRMMFLIPASSFEEALPTLDEEFLVHIRQVEKLEKGFAVRSITPEKKI